MREAMTKKLSAAEISRRKTQAFAKKKALLIVNERVSLFCRGDNSLNSTRGPH